MAFPSKGMQAMRRPKGRSVLICFFALILLQILFSGCQQKQQEKAQENQDNEKTGGDSLERNGNLEKVSFKTEDDFTIKGDLSRGGKKAALLLHQFNSDRTSYNSLAAKLGDANLTGLAIDLRGHGESVDQNGIKRTVGSFSERDFRDMTKDVKAAKKYLEQQGFSLYAIVGSSIGANTAVTFSATDQSTQKIVLLSPGLNFKGIETEGPSRQVKAKALIVASEEDDYSFGSARALQQNIKGSEFMPLKGAGHGTNMFRGTNLENDIVKWLLISDITLNTG